MENSPRWVTVPASLEMEISRPRPSVTEIFCVSKSVGETTGSTHNGSGVAGLGHPGVGLGKGVRVGSGVFVGGGEGGVTGAAVGEANAICRVGVRVGVRVGSVANNENNSGSARINATTSASAAMRAKRSGMKPQNNFVKKLRSGFQR